MVIGELGGVIIRLPIVQFPRIVVENLAYFAPVFETAEQRKHFVSMSPAIKPVIK